ncbi:cell division protein FtsA [Thermoclostridium caenicola]|nr:cell division FtsA domain-containing protein [Thermoclostridium caenicola]HOL84330.1 cell division FtsA domain-containing protein [Thermoclostridium caenicola]HPO76219.1 cell division FtsA domain-containing protein [Thermoclostridium caenicola]
MPKRRRKRKAMPEDAIFVLDIGTRTIIGLVGIQQGQSFVIRAAEVLVHESRAMMDGQIHDIAKVASGVSAVREALEQKTGFSLDKVSIAAAGRVLKTCRVKVERELEEGREIDSHLVSAMEMEAIQKAQLQIDGAPDKQETDQYYCVGHSVVSYYLNDYAISSLTGHKGQKAGVEVIATFLPQMVVESLYTVMERAGLEVTYLTLEPIAALNVAIPKELRLLNLALVDVGAGTSDIAVTKSGTIVAYDMAPVAGDEITEAIAQNFLVDFNTAESIKLALSAGETDIRFTDVLDNQVTIKPEDVENAIRPVVAQLAETISQRILVCNGGKAPNAVFLVGGGSQTPGLCEAVAEKIGLPRERVAVRNRSIAKNIVIEGEMPSGPESITPLGILVTTGLHRGTDFYTVSVNGQSVKVFNSQRVRVADVLALAGFNPEQLICKSGKRLRFFLNGESRTLAGGIGKPALIMVNDVQESLTAVVSPGDSLTVIPAERGKDAQAVCADLLGDFPPVTLRINDETHFIPQSIRINGQPVDAGTLIKDGDRVDISMDYTVSDIAGKFEIDLEQFTLEVDGKVVDGSYRLRGGETLVCRLKAAADPEPVPEPEPVFGPEPEPEPEPVFEPEPEPEPEPVVAATSARDTTDFSEASYLHTRPAVSGEGISVIVNGQRIQLPIKQGRAIFVDVFNHIDLDLSRQKGTIVLKLNGRDAGYTDVIREGDVIEIYWRE